MHRFFILSLALLSACGRKEPPAPVEVGPGRPIHQMDGLLYRGSTDPIPLPDNADQEKNPLKSKDHSTFVFPIASRQFVQNPPPSAEQGLNILAQEGELFWAIEDGSVIYAGFDQELGNTVIIRHSDEWISIYAHALKILVKTGQIVKQKQSLGKVGKTGQVNRPMLHFELRQESKSVNPLDFIK